MALAHLAPSNHLIAMSSSLPKTTRSHKRIVCLSAEIADWLWRLGAWECVAGLTAYFEPPPEAAPKPRVSGFNSLNLPHILKLEPDLVITFSDVQAHLAASLVQQGLPVLATNQRTLAETGATLAMIARLVQREAEGDALLAEWSSRLAPARNATHPPLVYFEEWHDPLISGISWVHELIQRAGGQDVFPELHGRRAAAERVVTSDQVLARKPEIILASWCGEPFRPEVMRNRPGWAELPAMRSRQVFEIPSADILQPGFRLVHGFERIKHIISDAGRNA